MLWGGRGGVKSWTAARYFLISGYQRPRRILCGREVQRSIKESVHQLLSDQIHFLGLGGFYDVLKTEIRGKNGTKFAFTGLSNLTAETIKSYEGYDGFWGEEAQAFTRRSIDILLPTIREEGSELVFTFNPELDTDEIYTRFVENTPEDCVLIDCSYHNNPWFPEVLEKERLEMLRQVENGDREESDYEWIWEGKCKPAVSGAIYYKQIAKCIEAGRFRDVPHDPNLFTHLIWDLGYSDNMSIGFVQKAGPSIQFIDYIEEHHMSYEEYVQIIRKKKENHGYRIALDGATGGKAWLPHDGQHKNAQTKKSPIEALNDLGLKADEDGIPDIGIKGRIEAGRQMFSRCLFDKGNCSPFFNRLRRYARKINLEDQATTIKKDGNDHAGDMYTYAAVIEKELTNESQGRAPIPYSDQGIV